MLTYYFLSKGYVVLDACDGEEALATGIDWDGQLDLLLTDIEMPGMGGMELARRLKQIHRAIAVIYMSGAPGPLTGCDPAPLLCKPINFDRLDTLVDGTLKDCRYHPTRKDLWHSDN
jgi:CheY-like chemotaxis protein